MGEAFWHMELEAFPQECGMKDIHSYRKAACCTACAASATRASGDVLMLSSADQDSQDSQLTAPVI